MSATRGRTGRSLLVLVFILLLATGLRFYRLDAQSFWNDEGNSARLSERSLDLIIEGTASDIHPPLYYLFLRGWRELLGATEFSLRAFSAYAGVFTVAVTLAMGRFFWRRRRGTVAAGLLLAVHPALIYYSQETRMYALLALWAMLATWLLLRASAAPARWRRYAVAYGLTAAAGLYTHYFFPVVLLGHNLLVLLWLWRREAGRRGVWFWRWSGVMAAAGLLFAPWLPIFWRQAGGRAQAELPLPDFLAGMGRFLLLGETGRAAWWTGALLVLLLVMVAWRLWRQPAARPAGVVLLIGLLLPVAFMIAAGTTRPAVFKFSVVAVPFLCLAVGLVVAARRPLWTPGRWRVPAGWLAWLLLFLPLLLLAGRSLQNLYFDPAYARADYRGLAARIEAANHPDAGVILNAANQWEVFTYYYEDVAHVYPLPRSYPDPDRIAAELSAIAAEHDRLYVLFWGEAERDPQRLVESWLDANAFKAAEEWVGDVRFVTYAVPATPATNMATPLAYPVGSGIILEGYTLPAAAVPAGDVLPLTLFWRATQPLSQRYKVFLHLVTADGQLVTQRDSEPGGGLAPTTTWPVAATVRDNHGVLVPLATAPGTYTLLLGLYDVNDPAARLPITTPAGVVDALPLAEIEVVR